MRWRTWFGRCFLSRDYGAAVWAVALNGNNVAQGGLALCVTRESFPRGQDATARARHRLLAIMQRHTDLLTAVSLHRGLAGPGGSRGACYPSCYPRSPYRLAGVG